MQVPNVDVGRVSPFNAGVDYMFTARFDQSYYELFSLAPQFGLNRSDLDNNYRTILKECHPDRFANSSEQELRLSVQYSSFVNEAYNCLRHELSRAQYLLKLQGFEPEQMNRSQASPEFLMMQMELRESLEGVNQTSDPAEALDNILTVIDEERNQVRMQMHELFANEEYQEAAALIVQWQFLDKLASEAEEKQVELEGI